ncbi:MAG TPA: YggU family protein [Ectothiorhodospiraceae bacterium]|nr:YggU family protein [Ectothiorhodospiraceae bacterium]
MSWYQWKGKQLIITLRVQPKASRDEIVGPYGEGANDEEIEALKIRISAPPVDGKANEQLIKFIAKQFGVARRDVELLSGTTGRNKRVAITEPKRLPEKARGAL